MNDGFPSYTHDAFLSYSRKDAAFAKLLQAELEKFSVPDDLQRPGRNLKIFRDESDFTGTAYYESIESELDRSAALMVICSPDAAKSAYVNDEISRYLRHDPSHARRVIPILLRGIPNNEATAETQQAIAFPPALCEAFEMPIAVDYRSFDPRRNKINKGAYVNAWFSLLANICSVSRADIEERERHRQARHRRIQVATVSVVFSALVIALGITLLSRHQAVKERQIAEERTVEAEAAAKAELVARNGEAAQRRVAEQETRLAIQQTNAAEEEKTLAEAQRDLATKAQRTAQAGELGANSLSAVSEDPQLSLLLGVEAATLSYATDDSIAPNVQEAVHRALLTQRQRLRISVVENGMVQALAFSPDRRWLATASSNGVRLWDTITGAPAPIEFPYVGKILTLLFTPDGTKLLAAGLDRAVHMWDIRTGKELGTFEGHTSYIWNLALSPDRSTLATASEDSTVKLWSMTSGQLLRTLEGHSARVDAVAFSHDGKLLASGGGDNSTRIWNVKSGRQLRQLPGGGNEGSLVRGVAFSPKGNRLATVNDGSTEVKIWDVPTGREVSSFQGHTSSVFAVAYSPDGSKIATTSLDKTARLWDASTGKELYAFRGHTHTVICLAFSADGAHLATGSEDGTANIWEIEQPNEYPSLVGHTSAVNDIAFSPDGTRLATASNDKTIRVWNVGVAEESARISQSDAVLGVTFSPDGKRIAAAGRDKKVTLFDSANGRKLSMLAGHTAATTSVAYSRDGTRLISGSDDQTVRIWDTATNKQLMTLRDDLGPVKSVDLNENGSLAAFSTDSHEDAQGRSAEVWDVAHNRRLFSLDGDYVWVNQVRFSPDGKQIVTTGSTAPFPVKVWDARTGRLLLTLAGHNAMVDTATFSPDGQQLATAGADGTIRLWALRGGGELLRLPSQHGDVNRLAFSPDGKQLAAASSDAQVRLYAIDVNNLIGLGASRLVRKFTADECRRFIHLNDCSLESSSKLFEAKQALYANRDAEVSKRFQEAPGGRQLLNDAGAKVFANELRLSEAHELAEVGAYGDASSVFERAFTSQDQSPAKAKQEAAHFISTAQVSSALRLESLDDWNGASAVLQQAVGSDPENEQAYIDLAQAYERTNHLDKAVAAMQRAIKTHPTSYNELELADYLRLNNQNREALLEAERAIDIDPTSELAHRIRAAAFRNLGDTAGAMTELQAAIAAAPTVYAYEQLSNIYESRKDYEKALECIEKGKSINPAYLPLYLDAEQIYHEDMNDYEAAYRVLAEAKSVAPDDLGLAADFAEACLTAQRFPEAMDAVNDLIGTGIISRDLSDSDKVAMMFVKVAALSLGGRSDEGKAAAQDMMSYLSGLGNFKQTWDYAGTRHFLSHYDHNKGQTDKLLQLLKVVESSGVRSTEKP